LAALATPSAPKTAANSAPAAHTNPPANNSAIASAATLPASVLAAPSVNPLGGTPAASTTAAAKAADDPTTAIRDALFEHLDRIASRKSPRHV